MLHKGLINYILIIGYFKNLIYNLDSLKSSFICIEIYNDYTIFFI